jgi:hypothetical protein
MPKHETLSQNIQRLKYVHKGDQPMDWHIRLTERCTALDCERSRTHLHTTYDPANVKEDVGVLTVFWNHRFTFRLMESARGDDWWRIEIAPQNQFTQIYLRECDMKSFMRALRNNGYHGYYEHVGHERKYKF